MIKLPNNQDPAVLAENIVRLRDGINAVDAKTLPDASEASVGQILKLDADKAPEWADEYSYTPPAYSATETDTGIKYNGLPVYSRVFAGNFEEITQTVNVTIATLETNVQCVMSRLTLYTNTYANPNASNSLIYNYNNNTLTIYSVQSTFSEGAYLAILWYVKPETRDDDTPEEPEVKKTTKKKTTK